MQYCFLFFSSYFWLCWVFNAAHGLFVAVSVFYVLVFWLACGILASQPGREPAPTCIGRRSLNPWTTREVLSKLFFKEIKKFRREKNTLLYVFICLLFLALFFPLCIFIFPWYHFLSPWRTFLAFLLVWIFYCRVPLAFVYLKMSLFHFHFFSVFFWNNHRFTGCSKNIYTRQSLESSSKIYIQFLMLCIWIHLELEVHVS